MVVRPRHEMDVTLFRDLLPRRNHQQGRFPLVFLGLLLPAEDYHKGERGFPGYSSSYGRGRNHDRERKPTKQESRRGGCARSSTSAQRRPRGGSGPSCGKMRGEAGGRIRPRNHPQTAPAGVEIYLQNPDTQTWSAVVTGPQNLSQQGPAFSMVSALIGPAAQYQPQSFQPGPTAASARGGFTSGLLAVRGGFQPSTLPPIAATGHGRGGITGVAGLQSNPVSGLALGTPAHGRGNGQGGGRGSGQAVQPTPSPMVGTGLQQSSASSSTPDYPYNVRYQPRWTAAEDAEFLQCKAAGWSFGRIATLLGTHSQGACRAHWYAIRPGGGGGGGPEDFPGKAAHQRCNC